jgi:hypothetical protein
MQKKINILFIGVFLFFSGCMSQIPKLTPSPNSPPSIKNVTFEEVDLNEDGEISKLEFIEVPQSQAIDTTTPVIWFIILIVLIGFMVCITKFLREKE